MTTLAGWLSLQFAMRACQMQQMQQSSSSSCWLVCIFMFGYLEYEQKVDRYLATVCVFHVYSSIPGLIFIC